MRSSILVAIYCLFVEIIIIIIVIIVISVVDDHQPSGVLLQTSPACETQTVSVDLGGFCDSAIAVPAVASTLSHHVCSQAVVGWGISRTKSKCGQ